MSATIPFLVAVSVLSVKGSAWRDPSPHEVRFVTVDSSVRLEVLDWDATGRPILFVGCYLSAHVYDNIAPKLIDQVHVYGVTRRGVGASDRPATGYDPQRRADDILEVIGTLAMQKPILIGNSCGGDILHTLGARHPTGSAVSCTSTAEDQTLTLALRARHSPRVGGSQSCVALPLTWSVWPRTRARICHAKPRCAGAAAIPPFGSVGRNDFHFSRWQLTKRDRSRALRRPRDGTTRGRSW